MKSSAEFYVRCNESSTDVKFLLEDPKYRLHNGILYEKIPLKNVFILPERAFADLSSYEETISFILDIDNECMLYPNSLDRLSDFWETYPDGLIIIR